MFSNESEFKTVYITWLEETFGKNLFESTKLEQFLTLGHMIMD